MGVLLGYPVYQDEATFYPALDAFLADSNYTRFRSDLAFDDDGAIEVWRYMWCRQQGCCCRYVALVYMCRTLLCELTASVPWSPPLRYLSAAIWGRVVLRGREQRSAGLTFVCPATVGIGRHNS